MALALLPILSPGRVSGRCAYVWLKPPWRAEPLQDGSEGHDVSVRFHMLQSQRLTSRNTLSQFSSPVSKCSQPQKCHHQNKNRDVYRAPSTPGRQCRNIAFPTTFHPLSQLLAPFSTSQLPAPAPTLACFTPHFCILHLSPFRTAVPHKINLRLSDLPDC